MTEQEKLKEICETIGYIIHTGDFYNGVLLKYEPHYTQGNDVECEIIIDVREIIFTPDFMGEYINFCIDNYAGLKMVVDSKVSLKNRIYIGLMNHLDNPVYFLYKLIK